ncbi:MAG TPA: ATP-dependent 6-phosphofructokinase [Elusimicrobiales bacterium]|nr:ATP-dependent 6-phosphofructokinase [Elusimicrobiales bacterium]
MGVKKIGILTGGGDCPGLNAVIRAVAKTCLIKNCAIVGFCDGYAGLVENRFIDITDKTVSGILDRGGTVLGTSNVANPLAYTLAPYGSPEKPADMTARVKEVAKQHKLDALVAIGGDGTLTVGLELLKKGLPVVGVPKTIDNDLAATDVTFGFDSALAVAADAVDKVHTTAESHHRVIVVETMGRYAGWIALRAGIAGGGDVILIPEIPFSNDAVCAAIQHRRARGKKFSIVVAAEGAVNQKGEQVVAKRVAGSPEPVRLGGIGYRIGDAIEKGCGIETRVVVLGHLQRGGSPTAFDRWLATRFGVHAALLAIEGKCGMMASLQGQHITEVSIEKAVKQLRRVDPAGEEVRVARSVGTSFGDPASLTTKPGGCL